MEADSIKIEQVDKSEPIEWALILGGSSGFGLASAFELAKQGLNICIIHRDRRGAMAEIEERFNEIRKLGIELLSFNLDALSAVGRSEVITNLKRHTSGIKIKLLLHSIALGSLKPIAPHTTSHNYREEAILSLSSKLNVERKTLEAIFDDVFNENAPALHNFSKETLDPEAIILDEEELLRTIHAMGASLLGWVSELFREGLFGSDARVVGLTSEGNTLAWKGYAAVAAAKCCLESLIRSIAREYGAHGIRANVLQPGITDTPALRLIPGHKKMMAGALIRNPLGRLTRVEDVAKVVAFMASDAASWINGSLIRVDGGEHISG